MDVVDRRVGQAVLAEHLQRHALGHLRQVVGLGQDLEVGVRVHVDEPGREHQPAGVDHAVTAQAGADLGDPSVVDAHVGAVAGRAGAVDHRRVAEDQAGHQK